jgi:hypothetical protein
MTEERSVIYVLDGYTLDIQEQGLIEAQNYSFEASLPLAVVSIVPGSELANPPIESLLSIERQLEPYGIPLIVLVGERAQALRGISNHLAPRIFPQATAESQDSLKTQSIKWPKRLQSVREVFAYAAEHPDMCLF